MFSCSVASNSLVTPWTIAHQAPLSMGLPRQEYWSGLPFPSPGDLPYPGIKLVSPALAGGFLTSEPQGSPISGIDALIKETPESSLIPSVNTMRGRRIWSSVSQEAVPHQALNLPTP